MPTIRLEHVAKVYNRGQRGHSATLEADLRIAQGEFVFIAGNRGSGKSTMAELIAGELEPDRGSVWLGGVNLGKAKPWERAWVTNCVGAVLEETELRATETVFKNLASSRFLEYLKDKYFRKREMGKALSLVGMPDSGRLYASELTVSECRRVELARAIWRSPSILVLDGLLERADDDTVWDILHLLSALNSRGTTVILTVADRSYGSILNKRVVTLVEGKVASDIKKK